MKDVAAALDQLNTFVFETADEVFALVEELSEEGLRLVLGDEGQPLQVADGSSCRS
jgi:hypothetical protein